MISHIADIKIGDGYPPRVVAVLNLSPESFYKGSVAVDNALDKALDLEKYADVVDVGAMSTAPYIDSWISPEKELERLAAVLPELVKNLERPISVDTYRPHVAEYALKTGAAAVNDVTGGKLYPEMCKVVREYDASVILVARERQPTQGTPIERVINALRESVQHFENCGVEPHKIIIDPGVGFPTLPPSDEPYVVKGEYRHGHEKWPWWKWDMYILAKLEMLKTLNKPILVGVSRKSFLRKIVNVKNPEEVLPASLAAETIAVLHGAHAIRTHNPRETRQAIEIAHAARHF